MNKAPDLPLKHSMLYYALFPEAQPQRAAQETTLQDGALSRPKFSLRRPMSFRIEGKATLKDLSYVVFDFETTGLSAERDEIIEVGAIKVKDGQVVGEMTALTGTDIVITEHITKLTGITKDMVAGKPRFDSLLIDFLEFVRGSVLVAHNAEFDWNMLAASARRKGIDLLWPVVCTVKMSRKVLPNLERHTLDSLADHYKLKFLERHRAVGDIKVLIEVFTQLLRDDPTRPSRWTDFKDYCVVAP